MSCSYPHKRIKLDTALQFAISFYQLFFIFFSFRNQRFFVCLLFICENLCSLKCKTKLVSLKLVSLNSLDRILGWKKKLSLILWGFIYKFTRFLNGCRQPRTVLFQICCTHFACSFIHISNILSSDILVLRNTVVIQEVARFFMHLCSKYQT